MRTRWRWLQPVSYTHLDGYKRQLYNVKVVLDDDDGVAVGGQPLQHAEQHLDVLEMQAGGRFVEDCLLYTSRCV